MALNVEIVTPTAVVFAGTVDEVKAPGFLGEFGVLPGHTPFLSVVTPGVVELITAGKVEKFVVGRGFVEAGPDRLTVLADSVEPAEGVDQKAAAELLETSEKLLASEAPGSDAYIMAKRDAELAHARLQLS
ncbi:MAG: F-type H+-transporting ATPase subunit epsilon [Cognaticolwellia sp.]|jgi:F-type H+-transporting ATPase subunit epsilon